MYTFWEKLIVIFVFNFLFILPYVKNVGAVGIVLYYRNLCSKNSFEKYSLGYVSAISIYILVMDGVFSKELHHL